MSQIGNLTLDPFSPVFSSSALAHSNPRNLPGKWPRLSRRLLIAPAFQFIFKASYDKANRTSVDSFRGPAFVEGCRILGEIGKELGRASHYRHPYPGGSYHRG